MRVHLGCGPLIKPGWLNLDMLDQRNPDYLKWDLTQGLPPECQAVEYIYSSHFIEHLTFDEATKLVDNCFSRMKSGGVFRVSFPDFYLTARAYLDNDVAFFNEIRSMVPRHTLMGFINLSLYQSGEHKCMWDTGEMAQFLTERGFQNARQVEFDPTVDPGDHVRQKYSAYVEAVKTL